MEVLLLINDSNSNVVHEDWRNTNNEPIHLRLFSIHLFLISTGLSSHIYYPLYPLRL